jgi:molybdopterin-guanine dinucleotide biosynthesis protein A
MGGRAARMGSDEKCLQMFNVKTQKQERDQLGRLQQRRTEVSCRTYTAQ